MSTSVRGARHGHSGGLIRYGAALILAGGVLVVALLAVASVATENLVVAISHRPNAIEGWRDARPSVRVAGYRPARPDAVASIYADQDLLDGVFHDAEAGAHGDAALEAKLAEASSLTVRTRSTVALGSAEPEVQAAKQEATPRVISPSAPIQLASLTPAMEPVSIVAIEPAPELKPTLEAERAEAPASPAVAEPVRIVPIPKPRPADLARMASAPSRAPVVPVRLEAAPQASRPTALAYAAPELETKSEGPGDFFKNLLDQEKQLNQDGAARMPRRGGGTAVYDIASATVRLPNGERLEAHSGLGHRQDNPAYVREKNHGPTPPNVYDLRMREALFHGAAAIRLLPRDQKKVFNRDGLLAHPYMYAGGGSRSQSNGCVVFKDYGRFLRAFRAGEIARLVVVPNANELASYMAGL